MNRDTVRKSVFKHSDFEKTRLDFLQAINHVGENLGVNVSARIDQLEQGQWPEIGIIAPLIQLEPEAMTLILNKKEEIQKQRWKDEEDSVKREGAKAIRKAKIKGFLRGLAIVK